MWKSYCVVLLLRLDCFYADLTLNNSAASVRRTTWLSTGSEYDLKPDASKIKQQFVEYFLSDSSFASNKPETLDFTFDISKILGAVPFINTLVNAISHRIHIVTDNAMCLGCVGISDAVIFVVKLGMSDESLISKLELVCNFVSVADDVCAGVLNENIPILTYIIRNQPNVTARSFCGLVLQDPDNVCPTFDDRYNWTVDIPEMPKNYTVPILNNEDITIALISDVHLDTKYAPGSVAECNAPICCRNQSEASLLMQKQPVKTLSGGASNMSKHFEKNPQRLWSLFGSSKKPPAGYWGDFRNCDTPLWTYRNVVEQMSMHKDIDVIYYLGDALNHFIWAYNYEDLKQASADVYKGLQDQFGDHVPIVSCIGNHEANPVNQFAPVSLEGQFNVTWLYKNLVTLWSSHLAKPQQQSMLEIGGYSTLIKPGLRVISLNNNVASNINWWVVYDPQESKKYLEWFISELLAAENAGEKVHLLTHIPAGEDDLAYTWTREYAKVIRRFAKTVITAEFNGHTHADEFKLYYDETGDPLLVAWNSGGTNTFQNFNLNYKIIKADGKTFDIKGIENYSFNMTDANMNLKKNPEWIKLYDYQREFGLEDLSAGSIDGLLKSMVQNNNLLLKYNEYYWKASEQMFNCDNDCILDNLCRNVITVLWDRSKCDELLKLYKYYNK